MRNLSLLTLSKLSTRLTRSPKSYGYTSLLPPSSSEPPLSIKIRSVCVHLVAPLISINELLLNDLPVLWSHLPVAMLLACSFSLFILASYSRFGRFAYLYAQAPRTSAIDALGACVLTAVAIAASFAALASISSSLHTDPS